MRIWINDSKVMAILNKGHLLGLHPELDNVPFGIENNMLELQL